MMPLMLDELMAFLLARIDEKAAQGEPISGLPARDAMRQFEQVLRRQAAAFSTHPDYKPEWAPERQA